MTVNDLREALRDLPGDAKVCIVPPTNDDEWEATVASTPKYGRSVLICANNTEISAGEEVLHDDNEEAR